MSQVIARRSPRRSGVRQSAAFRAFAVAVAVAGLLSACSAPSAPARAIDDLGADDQRMLSQIAPIAARDAAAEHPRFADCWVPSDHAIDGEPSHFKVLCRVAFDEAGEQRERDMICIGAFDDDPPLDYCYDWAYYTDMPSFDDADAVRLDLSHKG